MFLCYSAQSNYRYFIADNSIQSTTITISVQVAFFSGVAAGGDRSPIQKTESPQITEADF